MNPEKFADIKEPQPRKEESGFELAKTAELDQVVEKASELAEAIQRDEDVSYGQVLDLEKALEKMMEADPRIEAKRLFGENYFGPDEIENHFTLGNGEKLFEYSSEQRREINRMLREKLDDPQIRDLIKRTPREELQKRFQLFLFPDKFKDGTPVTMKALYERFQPEMIRRGLGKLFHSEIGEDNCWYYNENNKEDFFTTDSNPLSWKLLSKGNIENSAGKDYVEETRFFREYLRKNNLATVDELDECSDERLAELTQLMEIDWRKAAEQLSELKINQKYRINPLEIIFVHAANKSALTNTYARTAKRLSGGGLVSVGCCVADGTLVFGWRPGHAIGDLGISFSR